MFERLNVGDYIRTGIIALGLILSGLPAYAQVGLFIRPNSSSLSAPVQGQTWLFNSTSNTIQVYDGSLFQLASAAASTYNQTIAPTSANDQTEGYSAGSNWYDTTTSQLYICVSAATSAAVWVQTNNLGSLSIPLTAIQQGGATTGQALIWNGSHWNPSTQSIGLGNLLQTGAVVGQVPIWNGTNWIAGNPPGGSASVPLSQISQSSATTNQVPKWNGSAWVAATLASGGNYTPNAVAATINGTITSSAQNAYYIDLSGLTSSSYFCHFQLPAASACSGQSIYVMISNAAAADGANIGLLGFEIYAGGNINGADPTNLLDLCNAGEGYIFLSDGSNWWAFSSVNQTGNAYVNESGDFDAQIGFTYFISNNAVVSLPAPAASNQSLNGRTMTFVNIGANTVTFGGGSGTLDPGVSPVPALANAGDAITLQWLEYGEHWEVVSSVTGNAIP